MARLNIAERASVVRLGWQAECAVQDRATHLVNSFSMGPKDAADLPDRLDKCAEIGRQLLRNHLLAVRKVMP